MPNKEHWQHQLESIHTIKAAGLKHWEPIHSGSSNYIFKVTTSAGLWIVRFNRAAMGISRQEEHRILEKIKPLDIGPNVIENDPDAGHLITEYIDQPTWQRSDLKNHDKLNQLKQAMNKYHAIDYEYLPSRLDHRLRLYLKNIKKIPERTTIDILENIQKLDFLGFWRANNSLYHSDLNLGNLLGDDSLRIIDWEFAGQGHPLLDWLILEHEVKMNLSDHFPDDVLPVWIAPARRLIRAIMKLWPHESP
ncbi:phosphotransferase [Marinicella marina]|nr:phosphotransferase [Marinicella marina]MDJ1139379.1 phosphotransferase [Marinicella marina]